MYDIEVLLTHHEFYKTQCIEHFEEFFRGVDYRNLQDRRIRIVDIRAHDDLNQVLWGNGFYLIATNYYANRNRCELLLPRGLKVIYRGHSANIRCRIQSHLFNTRHQRDPISRRFEVCMRLDDRNGIDVDEAPYNHHVWQIVQHSMQGSLELMREAAECAFDNVFGRPLASQQ